MALPVAKQLARQECPAGWTEPQLGLCGLLGRRRVLKAWPESPPARQSAKQEGSARLIKHRLVPVMRGTQLRLRGQTRNLPGKNA